jgi:hypothetical protein
MGNAVDSAFATFDRALNLDPTQRKRAQERHLAVTNVLKDAGFVESTFLQGSFARKTMLKPLKDVDIVVVIKREYWDVLSGPQGPALAMKWFEAAITDHWPEATFDDGDEPAAKAVRVSFPDLDFDVDLVPAFEAEHGNVLIGNREEQNWETSSTRRLNDVIAKRNQSLGGRFVHQVRELKQLIKHHDELSFVKGIVVESLAYAVITANVADKNAVLTVLEHAAHVVGGPVMTPTGDEDVIAGWSRAERITALRVFRVLADQANEALHVEATGDSQAAIDLWNNVIGDPFPNAEIRPPGEALAAWASGSRTSTGRTTPSSGGRQPVRPGRAWAPR